MLTPLPSPKFKTDWLANPAYGFPEAGGPRRVKPGALACLHHTASASAPPATAQNERDYVSRAGLTIERSAHLYVERDPNLPSVWAVDPSKYAAWSNGAVKSPRTAVPGIQAMLDFRAKGYNANEWYDVEIEICDAANFPILPQQMQTVSYVLAARSIITGLPIQRSTVHGHFDIDSVNKVNCPVPLANGASFLNPIMDLANQYRDTMFYTGLQAELASTKEKLRVSEAQLEAAEAALRAEQAIGQEREVEWRRYENRVHDHFTVGLAIPSPEELT